MQKNHKVTARRFVATCIQVSIFLVLFPINDVIRMNERPKSTAAAAAFVLQRIHLSLAVRRLSHNISIPSIKVTFNIVTVRKLCASEGYASFVNWAVFPISHDDDDLSRGEKRSFMFDMVQLHPLSEVLNSLQCKTDGLMVFKILKESNFSKFLNQNFPT